MRIATLVVAVIVGVLVLPVPGGAATDPMLRFEVTDPVVEGAAGTTTTVTIAANLDRPADHEVRWRWLTFDQPDWVDEFRPATPGVDYIEAGGVLTFAPGATTASIDIDVLGDGVYEHPEFVAIIAVPLIDDEPDLSRFAPTRVRVLDDDASAMPRVIPGVASVAEDADGAVLEVPVTLDRPTELLVTVRWQTLNVPTAPGDQAFSPDDYVAGSGTLSFLPSASPTPKIARIPIVDDALPEPDEYVVVSFHSPTEARMGGFWGLGFGIIVDDD